MTGGAADAEVTLFLDEGGLYVAGDAEGVDAVLEQLLSPAELEAHRTGATRVADAAAGAASVAAAAATAQEYLRLSPDSLAKVREFGAQADQAGALRGYVRGEGGRIAGQLTFESVSVGAEQALALQTAAVSLALRSAIANVQAAVDQVDEKVSDIQRRVGARDIGDVVGAYRHLERTVAATTERGHLLEADWDAVAGAGLDLSRALEAMRAYVTKTTTAISPDASLPKRESAVKKLTNPDGVAGTLRLILIAEQALHLWEYLRIERVRQTDPAHVRSTLEDARRSLRTQHEMDERLLTTCVERLAQVRKIDPLEVHRLLTIPDMEKASARALDEFERFADAARSPFPELDREVRRPHLSETRAEVKRQALDAKDGVVHVTRAASQVTARSAQEASRQLRRRLGR
jgi:hypothetical protein